LGPAPQAFIAAARDRYFKHYRVGNFGDMLGALIQIIDWNCATRAIEKHRQ